jgi:hypothetical protein
MNDFDEILYRLIRDNRRVIIPGVGAFINAPAGDSAIFSSLLKHNDGFLEDEMRKKGVADPAKFIAEFAENVTSLIEIKGQHYHIEGLGYFFKDDGVGFVFEKNNVCENLGDVRSSEKKDGKNRIWRILGLTGLCLSTSALLFFVIFRICGQDGLIGKVSSGTEKSGKQFVIIDKSGDDDHGAAENETNNLQPSPQIKNYHVVVACFEEKFNAENFVLQCRKIGYDKAEILFFTDFMYPVSIGRFAMPDEALKQKREYDGKFGENSLIFKTK